MGIFIIGIVFMLISMAVSARFKSKIKKYSQETLAANMSGREIAEKMLKDSNIYDVKITCVEGQLTDHYNPTDKTVNLSPEVYHGRTVISAAVAAHEVGHAVQHATAYSMLHLRSSLVPLVNISGKVMNIIVIGSIFFGTILYSTFPFQNILLVIIAAHAIMTSFSLITLPVEFDASNRAMVWLRTNNILRANENDDAKDALKWAAMTYVVAALAALSQLLYYISMFMGSRDE